MSANNKKKRLISCCCNKCGGIEVPVTTAKRHQAYKQFQEAISSNDTTNINGNETF